MGLHIFLFRICAITSRQDGLQPDHLDATCRVVLAEKADLGGNALTEDVDMAYDAYRVPKPSSMKRTSTEAFPLVMAERPRASASETMKPSPPERVLYGLTASP